MDLAQLDRYGITGANRGRILLSACHGGDGSLAVHHVIELRDAAIGMSADRSAWGNDYEDTNNVKDTNSIDKIIKKNGGRIFKTENTIKT